MENVTRVSDLPGFLVHLEPDVLARMDEHIQTLGVQFNSRRKFVDFLIKRELGESEKNGIEHSPIQQSGRVPKAKRLNAEAIG